jgi:hypothetical protein
MEHDGDFRPKDEIIQKYKNKNTFVKFLFPNYKK